MGPRVVATLSVLNGDELRRRSRENYLKALRDAGCDVIAVDAEHPAPDEFDALLIPGGGSPDKLRAHETPVRFVKSFMQAGKPVMAICHGPQLLLTADEYKGHKMTAWKTIQGDLKKAGGNVVDQEVVVDRNLVTSRQPQDLPAFIREGLALLDKVPATRS